MSNARVSSGWGLQSIRRGVPGIVRLLLLALSLQLSIPLVDGVAPVSLAPAGSFAADLGHSLCHDTSDGEHGAPVSDESNHACHCLFCLPLLGAHATPGIEFTLPVPRLATAVAIAIGDQRQPAATHYILARGRAPPRESSPA